MGLGRGDRVGILTSGGDSPGMNAAVRAAARVAVERGFVPLGIENGYRGLLEGTVRALDLRALDEAARRGGTVLGTARSKAFASSEGQEIARRTLEREGIRALLVIGGNGSLTGLRVLEHTMQGSLLTAGLPASIDNDLAGTSMAIGVDTALNTIVEACDRIGDTAHAHRRAFLVEVMGRDCGYLAMAAGVALAADAVLVPEAGRSDEAVIEQVVRTLTAAYRDAGKRHVLVLKAEGVKLPTAALKEAVDARLAASIPDVDTRVTVLGHVVRGGAPSAFDRLLAARLAHAAMRALADGQSSVMAGWTGPGITREACPYDPYVVLTPLAEVLADTERLMKGDTDLARWRKKIIAEAEGILRR